MHQLRWLSERGGLPFKFDSERGGTQKGDLPSEKARGEVKVGFQHWSKLWKIYFSYVV